MNAEVSSARDFVISRTFDAPRDLVWRAWTESNHLLRWFGPPGCTISVAKLDLRPGGVFHYGMRTPDGATMWGKWTFVEIDAPRKLVVIVSFSDEQGGITVHPMNPDWPRETFATTTFEEHGDQTTIIVRWAAYRATAQEQATFDAGHDSMRGGWGGTMDQLAAYLAQAQQG
ncbi:MAG TPA: SRPBCC domain-containing protein [Xanthomonadaceae bacterium]|jgi:uncharacterized protein YndB with AHSA1/START domain|nr:SRPBCC domain-containing protein [Xanthomonadaceae bacterium]